jgi:hypothetical protein
MRSSYLNAAPSIEIPYPKRSSDQRLRPFLGARNQPLLLQTWFDGLFLLLERGLHPLARAEDGLHFRRSIAAMRHYSRDVRPIG